MTWVITLLCVGFSSFGILAVLLLTVSMFWADIQRTPEQRAWVRETYGRFKSGLPPLRPYPEKAE